MEVKGQFHAPAAFCPGKTHRYPLNRKTGESPEPAWTLWKEKSLAVTGNRTATNLVVEPAAKGLGKLNVYSSMNRTSSITRAGTHAHAHTHHVEPVTRKAMYTYNVALSPWKKRRLLHILSV